MILLYMKYIALYISFFILSVICLSNEKTDSLITISQKQKGIQFLHTYLNLAEYFSYENNADTTLYYSRICLKEAEKLKDSVGIMRANLYIASGLFLQRKYVQCRKRTVHVLKYASQLKRNKEIIQAKYMMARTFQYQKKYKMAIPWFTSCYESTIKLIIQKKASKHIIAYCKGTLTQLAYTYVYGTYLKEGTQYYLKQIKLYPNAPPEILRSYYCNIAHILTNAIDYKRAVYYLIKALHISKQLKNPDDLYQDYAYMGVAYMHDKRSKKALKCFNKALEIAKQQNNSSKIAYILNVSAECYNNLGNLKRTVETKYKSLGLFRSRRDTTGLAMIYNSLGYLMLKWQNSEDAKKYLFRSLRFSCEMKRKINEGNNYTALCRVYMWEKNRDSTIYYNELLGKIAMQSKSTQLKTKYLINKGDIELKFNSNPQKALSPFYQALEQGKRNNLISLCVFAQMGLGRGYLMMDSLKQAKNHLRRAWDHFKIITDPVQQRTIAQNLSELYSRIHKSDSAYYYLKKSETIHDQINQREAILAMYKKDNDFELHLAKEEKKILNRKNHTLLQEITQTKLYTTLITVASLLLIYMFMFRRTRKLRKTIVHKHEQKEKLSKVIIQNKKDMQKINQEMINKELAIQKLEQQFQNQPLANNKPSNDSEHVYRLINSKLTTEDDWEEYLKLFNQKVPNYLSQLRNLYPNLTRNEIKLFTLLKLNFTTREMADILMVSPSSVNTARYRLRKKLKLSPNQRLEKIAKEN